MNNTIKISFELKNLSGLIKLFGLIMLAMIASHCLNILLGRPHPFNELVDLGMESNIPTWISSFFWFISGLLAAYVASSCNERVEKGCWYVLAVFLFLFSLDEEAMLHERIFSLVYHLFFQHSAHEARSIWSVGGLPVFIPILAILFYLAVRSFKKTHAVRIWIFTGLFITLFSGWGMEISINIFPAELSRVMWQLENILEEMGELVGCLCIIKGVERKLLNSSTLQRAKVVVKPAISTAH